MTTIIEALYTMHHAGIRQIDIYYAELINDGETCFSVDVMCDQINDICKSSWTWTIYSLQEVGDMLKYDPYFVCVDWEIITDVPFSEDVVRKAVQEWMIANKLNIHIQVIDIDDAVGSGYVKTLREMDLEWEIDNSTPLATSVYPFIEDE